MDYPYLRAWNVFLGASPTYNLEIARDTCAPANAIYHESGDKWRTFDDIKSTDTKAQIEELVVRFK